MSDFYTDLAAALRGIADDLAGLAGAGLPQDPKPYVCLDIQPKGDTDAEKVRAVDAVGRAVLGETRVADTSAINHYGIRGHRGGVSINVYERISSPEDRVKDEELARLRAELERLRDGPKRRYRCEGCGKTSRIAAHAPGCPVAAALDREQAEGGESGG